MTPLSPLKAMTHRVEFSETNNITAEPKVKRTTIMVNPDTYRKFKAYAAQTGQSITALINEFMEKTMSEGK